MPLFRIHHVVRIRSVILVLLLLGLDQDSTNAINGGRSQIIPSDDWKAIEVISEGDSKGSDWEMPDNFDGAGAFLVSENVIRIHVNHEESESSISEVNVNKNNLKQAISNMIRNGNTGGQRFVESARLAYERWTVDGGENFRTNVNPGNTDFCKFCSSQAYKPNTFGGGRGFVDQLYITGEECSGGSLFVLDSRRRTLYKLSGFTGSSNDSRGGMPFGPWENAALIDTRETDFIALLLSPDGGGSREIVQLYIGHKGKTTNGRAASDFLSRNGLAYGEYYYLKVGFPTTGSTNSNGSFSKERDGGLGDDKLEDIDTNPNNPRKVVLAETNRGLFTLDFNFRFNSNGLDSDTSSFSITKIPSSGIENPDNVEWSANGQIFVNEDSSRGGVWYTTANGDSRTRIGRTRDDSESSGIFDFSEFVDYPPGHIMITTSQGSPGSMTLLIRPSSATTSSTGGRTPGQSSLASVSPPEGAIVFEAEDAVMEKGRVETRYSPFSGEGYADMQGSGSSLRWDHTDIQAGQYEVSVSYASGSDRPAYFMVDGTRYGEFRFRETPSWFDWVVETMTVQLEHGDHRFMISAEQSTGPNIDWLALRPLAIVNPTGIGPDGFTVYEAEDGSCELCSIKTTHEGFTGSGYVDFREEQAYLQWTIAVLTTTTYDVIIRYASGPDRPADFLVDGDKEADLQFEGSGWRSWRTEGVNGVSLTEGTHTLRIDCGQKSSGPNVDYIALRESSRRAEERVDTIGLRGAQTP